MDPIDILTQFYEPGSRAYTLLIAHGLAVGRKAEAIAGRLEASSLDLAFIRESAMLHDIGIFMTYAPELGCFGNHSYICHGYLGSLLLRDLGFPRHARVCENHVGVGLSRSEIVKNRLPLPTRDMLPQTTEEQILCYADKFFSKTAADQPEEKSVETIARELETLGTGKAETFLKWMERFGC